MNLKVNYCCLLLFFFVIPIAAGDCCDTLSTPLINVKFDTNSRDNCSRSIHAQEWKDHYKQNKHYYAHLTTADFHRIFAEVLNQDEVLSNYELHAYPAFREYARSLSRYNEFIVSLGAKIRADKYFRKKTAYIPGFVYSFGLRGENSEFHDFVFEEVQRIEKLRNKQETIKKQGSLCINQQALNYLGQEWSVKSKMFGDNIRMVDRLNALHVTRTHKNRCADASFATELDYQLYKELTESRGTMHNLERNFAHSYHVIILSPLVRNCAAQAAQQQCPIAAFQLSDFCHMVTQVLQRGMHVLYDATNAVAKGVANSVISIVSVDHWKDMATGCLQLGLLFVDAVRQEDALHYAVISSALSQDSDVLLKKAQQYCVYTQAQKDMVNFCAQETYKKLKSMTWQELLEGGTEVGMTMVLDLLTLHVVGGFARAGSNAFFKQLSKVSESGILFTEQYALEVAGFGRLIAEEGVEVSGEAFNIIEQNLTKFESNGELLSQVIKEKIATKQITFEMTENIAVDGVLFYDLQSIGNKCMAINWGYNLCL